MVVDSLHPLWRGCHNVNPEGAPLETTINPKPFKSSNNPTMILTQPTPDVRRMQLKVQRSGLNVAVCTESIPLENLRPCEACQILFPFKQLRSHGRLVAGKILYKNR